MKNTTIVLSDARKISQETKIISPYHLKIKKLESIKSVNNLFTD